MPQLNTAIYFHQYGWLFLTFFFFYLIFLKYYLPKVIRLVKIESNHLVYHLNLISNLDQQLKKENRNKIRDSFYKLLLAPSLLNQLTDIYRKNLGNQVGMSQIERTAFNLLDQYIK
jgi:hypothetical protein